MTTKNTLLFIAVINLTSLCLPGFATASQPSNALQQLNNHYDIDTAALSHLYPHPDDYLWLDQQSLNVQAYDALNFISRSANHGLDPNDYHQDLLHQLDPYYNPADNHLFDLMLTDGLLKLIRDISRGRLDPTVADPKWTIPRTPFDAAQFLKQALLLDNFGDSLDSLVPTSVQYQQLSNAANHYQALVERGGWFKIPATPTLHPDDDHENITSIRNRLSLEDDSLNLDNPTQSNKYDKNLVFAVQKFQRRYSLKDDGIIGPTTVRAMNVSAAERLQQININLERLRWLPENLGNRYIMVNLANYQLTAVENDTVKLNMRVIVGKTKRPTPSFSSKMTHVVFNPNWYVPAKLARLDLLPKQQSNPNYLAKNNFRVFNKVPGNRTEVDPDDIDWQTLSEHHFPYSLRQGPGTKNALGQLKFILPNKWAIYLHDTPSKSLFNQTKRNFSSGCIRVEDPLALAKFSLPSYETRQSLVEIINKSDVYKAKLEVPLSVYAIYSTVWFDGNELTFSPDSYLRDHQMAKYL